jgi:hypothetical protein
MINDTYGAILLRPTCWSSSRYEMVKPNSIIIFFLALASVGIFSTSTFACTLLQQLEDSQPEEILVRAAALHIGKVSVVDRDEAMSKQVLDISVNETLLGKPLYELTVNVPYLRMCGWIGGIFEAGDDVIIIEDKEKNRFSLLAFHYSSTAYIDRLRKLIKESQSNFMAQDRNPQ